MPRPVRLPLRLMRIPWPTHCGPILFQHGLEHLQARGHDQLLELGLGIHQDLDQREVAHRRGFRLATTRDCARLLLHGGSFAGEACTSGSLTGRIARPARSRRFKFQQLLGHPHEAVSRRHEEGWTLAEIQQLLGHANIKTTSTYLNVTTTGLQAAMRRSDGIRCNLVAIEDAEEPTA